MSPGGNPFAKPLSSPGIGWGHGFSPASLPVGLRLPSRAAGGNSGGKPCAGMFPAAKKKRFT